MATEIGKARVRVEFDQSSIDQGLGDAQGGILSKLGLSGKLGGAALAAGIGAGVVVAGKALFDIGATFDDMNDTIRVGTGASGEALDGLMESAKNVGKSVPAEWSAIGTTVADLNTRLGLTGDTLETVASQYLEAGRMLGTEVDINATTAAFSAFKIEGDGVVDAMDSLFRTSQATGVGMNELASAAQTNGVALQELGFNFDESIALIGSLDKAGLNSTQTLAAMSKGMVTLARDGEEPQEAFQRVTGEIGALIDAGDTAAAIDLASGIFGTRGAAQFVGAVESGTLALDDLVGGLGASEDTILGVGAETQDFAEKWQLLKNNAQAALEPLASKVFDSLGDSLDTVMPLITSLGTWLADNTWALGAFAAVVGGTLVGAFVAWTASVWASTFALLANPVTWIVLGIVALIAALVLLIANWDSVVAFLKDVWAGIVEWLGGVWDSIKSGIESAWNGIADFFSGLWDGIKSTASAAWDGFVTWIGEIPGRVLDFFLKWTLPGLLITHWDSIKRSAEEKWNGLVTWVGRIPGRFVSGLAAIGTTVRTAVRDAVSKVKDAATDRFDALIEFVKDLPARIVRGLGNLGNLLKESGRKIIQGLADGITGAVGKVTDAIGGVMKKVRDFLPFSPAKTGPFSGKGWSLYSGRSIGEDLAKGLVQNRDKVANAADALMQSAMVQPTRLTAPRLAASAELEADGYGDGRRVEQRNEFHGLEAREAAELAAAKMRVAMYG